MRLVIKTSPQDDAQELARQMIDALRGRGFSACVVRDARPANGPRDEVALALDLEDPYESASDLCSVLCLRTDEGVVGAADLGSYDVILSGTRQSRCEVPLALGVIANAVQPVLAARLPPSRPLAAAGPASAKFVFPDALFGPGRGKGRWWQRTLRRVTTYWFWLQAVVRDGAIKTVRSLPRPVQRAGRRAVRALQADRLLPAALRPHRYPSASKGSASSAGGAKLSGDTAAALQSRTAELEREVVYWRTQSYRLLEELTFLQARDLAGTPGPPRDDAAR